MKDGFDRYAARLMDSNPGPCALELHPTSSYACSRTREALEVLGCQVQIHEDGLSLTIQVPAR